MGVKALVVLGGVRGLNTRLKLMQRLELGLEFRLDSRVRLNNANLTLLPLCMALMLIWRARIIRRINWVSHPLGVALCGELCFGKIRCSQVLGVERGQGCKIDLIFYRSLLWHPVKNEATVRGVC